MTQQPYSLDLVPCDLFPIPKIEDTSEMKEERFATIYEKKS